MNKRYSNQKGRLSIMNSNKESLTEHNSLFHGDLVSTSRIIYTPSSFAKSSLLHIQEIGTLQATKPHFSRRKNLSSYLFFWVHSGSGTLFYDGLSYDLIPGDCVFIDCRKPYYHATSENLWKLSWIHFDGPTASSIYDKYIERGGLPKFHPEQLLQYQLTHTNLYKIAISDSYVKDMKINEGLSSLLVFLMEDAWSPENAATGKKSSLLSIKNYLDQNYSKRITLDELAERYYLNKYYLTRIFKEQYGMSINGYLQSVRITKVKQELRFTQKSIQEIAMETGFGSGYYLSRLFTKVEGISPSEYRKQWG